MAARPRKPKDASVQPKTPKPKTARQLAKDRKRASRCLSCLSSVVWSQRDDFSWQCKDYDTEVPHMCTATDNFRMDKGPQ